MQQPYVQVRSYFKAPRVETSTYEFLGEDTIQSITGTMRVDMPISPCRQERVAPEVVSSWKMEGTP